MSEGPDNSILQYLRRMDAKLDRFVDDISDIEVSVAGLNRLIDGAESRLDRIERSLDLVDARR